MHYSGGAPKKLSYCNKRAPFKVICSYLKSLTYNVLITLLAGVKEEIKGQMKADHLKSGPLRYH